MRGDLILYEAVKGVPFDWLIATFTHGKFAHVEIDMGGGHMVSEHGNGLTISGFDAKRPHVLVTPHGNIDAGMTWIAARVAEAKANGETHEYGWLDVLTEAGMVFGSKLSFGLVGHWDCSNFATRYLVWSGAAAPLGVLADEPGRVSPNDLARAYGVPVK